MKEINMDCLRIIDIAVKVGETIKSLSEKIVLNAIGLYSPSRW
jgi:hypothetical protein